MKAMVVVPDGGDGSLRWQELPDPEPGPGEVVIAVRAAAVNRADLSMRRGTYRQDATARRDGIVVDRAGGGGRGRRGRRGRDPARPR
jgi:NADPH:quinone reductase and related Zn-dependent oxidoreductases